VIRATVFGTHVVCASDRVGPLPGGLLPSQHRRQSIVFRVLFQQTNKPGVRVRLELDEGEKERKIDMIIRNYNFVRLRAKNTQ